MVGSIYTGDNTPSQTEAKVRVVRSTIAEVVTKTQPRAEKPAAKKDEPANDEETDDKPDTEEGDEKKSVFRRRR